MRAISLRLKPAANGQASAINFAADYSLGAIAQLGERVTGSHEVGGSNPPSSTPRPLLRAASLRPGPSVFDRAPGRLAPELLEPVELARVRREEVHDHVEVV